MSIDVIPTNDRELVDMLQNLGVRLAAVVSLFNLGTNDSTAVTTDATNLRNLVLDQEDKHNAAKSATEAKLTARTTIVRRARALIRRLKSHPSYTPALGAQLGIVAPESTAQPMLAAAAAAQAVVSPDLRGVVAAQGEVEVRFAKNGFTGVLIYGRRGQETTWTLLAKQLRSPFVDTRANLEPGEPETREYRAVYVQVDQPVGQMSDTLTVTVPAIVLSAAGIPTTSQSSTTPTAAAA